MLTLPAVFTARLLQFLDSSIECLCVATFHAQRVERLIIDICDIFTGDDQKRLDPAGASIDIERNGLFGVCGAAWGYFDS